MSLYDYSYLNARGLCLTRQPGDCVTISTSDGPIEVEFFEHKGSSGIVLHFRAPKSVRILRNEVIRREGYDPSQDFEKELGTHLKLRLQTQHSLAMKASAECPNSDPLGLSLSKDTSATSRPAPLAQFLGKLSSALSKRDSSNINPNP